MGPGTRSRVARPQHGGLGCGETAVGSLLAVAHSAGCFASNLRLSGPVLNAFWIYLRCFSGVCKYLIASGKARM